MYQKSFSRATHSAERSHIREAAVFMLWRAKLIVIWEQVKSQLSWLSVSVVEQFASQWRGCWFQSRWKLEFYSCCFCLLSAVALIISLFFSIGDCVFSSPQTGAVFLSPHAASRLALIISGNSIEGIRDAVHLATPTIPPMTRSPFSNMVPDYVITGPSFRAQGPGGYLCAGFWDNRWEYQRVISSCVCWPMLKSGRVICQWRWNLIMCIMFRIGQWPSSIENDFAKEELEPCVSVICIENRFNWNMRNVNLAIFVL